MTLKADLNVQLISMVEVYQPILEDDPQKEIKSIRWQIIGTKEVMRKRAFLKKGKKFHVHKCLSYSF